MRKFVTLAALAALAACGQESAPAEQAEATADPAAILEGDAPGFEAVAPGDYTVEHANGDIDTITIHPGMTYSRVAADGSATGGTIFNQGGKTCFVVEGVEGHNCFTDGPVQPDGSIQTTSEAGDVSTVRPVGAEGAAPASGSE